MGFLLNQLFQFVRLLNSDKGTNQIAAGIACGFVLGMTPAFSLQTVVIFVLLFFFRVQIGAAFLSAVFFAIPAFVLDPVFDRVGRQILEIDGLHPLLTQLYHLPIVPMTRFYNSVVMGAGVVSLILTPLIFVAARILIVKYRAVVVSRLEKFKFIKVMKSTTVYQWYLKYENLKG